MSLQDRFDLVRNSYSDVQQHIPAFLKAVEDTHADTVVELGVRYGVSTVAWIYATQGYGRCYGVDCSFPDVEPNMGVNLLDTQDPTGMGVQDHFSFILGNAHSWLIHDLLPEQIDVLFIDTNHVYEETLMELKMYFHKVRKGGLILMHDTAIEDTPNRGDRPKVSYPVLTAIKEFTEQYGLEFTNVEYSNGLGTIYV